MPQSTVHGVGIQSIAFTGAVGNIVGHVQTQFPEKGQQQGGGRDAVDIVIAIDRDAFLLAQSPQQALDGPGHAV
jgi:hypothetical protein